MKLISTEKLKPGMIVARPIISDAGILLLNSDVTLNDSLIELIKRRGIPFLYVKDDRIDTDVKPLISPDDTAKAVYVIKKAFDQALQSSLRRSSQMNLEHLLEHLNDIVSGIVEIISRQNDLIVHLIDIKNVDSYTFQHSLQVMTISLMIGKSLDMTKNQLHNLGMGAVLHDIGKVGIPKSILNKEGPLTEEERNIVRQHPKTGFELLQDCSLVWPTARAVVLQHHEKWDGSGYPRGLAGEDIHIYSRIVAPVNVYDALISKRPYQESMLPHQAYYYIKGKAGLLFDPLVVEKFLDIVAPYPIGTWVKLNSGEVGLVTSIEPGKVAYPVVKIFYDNNLKPMKNPTTISLSENSILSIDEVVEEPSE
ncbi:HD-GYP domain-containing protein [Acetomicrobium sp. UBA5826]|uniref:HD-GYP domain-containing protein n=1 Tax=Acetomicrobium sp. UBA5826 TaxID=1946039 RepID=UPI00257FE700|nr:HD-GYP domain-containing protein [Acetomicrobium sp. UBA5826]